MCRCHCTSHVARNCCGSRNHWKRILKEARSNYAETTRRSIAPQLTGSRDFWRISDSVLNRENSTIPPLFIGPKILTTSTDKANLFDRNFTCNSNLDDGSQQLPDFPSRTEQKLSYSHAGQLKLDLRFIVEWGNGWLVTFNASKTKLLSFNRHRDPLLVPVEMNGIELPEETSFRLLGLTFTRSMDWKPYIQSIAKAVTRKVGSVIILDLWTGSHIYSPLQSLLQGKWAPLLFQGKWAPSL